MNDLLGARALLARRPPLPHPHGWSAACLRVLTLLCNMGRVGRRRGQSLACWQVSCCASPAAGRLVCAHRDVSQGYTSPLLHRCVGMSARACLLALAPASTEVRGTTLLQCWLGVWAGCDVSSGPRQYFGDDYLTSLACVRVGRMASTGPHRLRLGLERVSTLVVRRVVIYKGQDTHTLN